VGTKHLQCSALVGHVLGEDLVLAPLAQTADVELLAAEFVTEVVGGLAAHHTRLASHGKSAAATKQVESEVVLESIHSVHYPHTLANHRFTVNRYFEKSVSWPQKPQPSQAGAVELF